MNKFCIASEAIYPRYISKIKEVALYSYLMQDINIPIYISTNGVDDFISNDKVKVFDINELIKGRDLGKELLIGKPVIYYKYPWNLRRFIIRKAAEDGYNGVVFIEGDVEISVSGEKFDKFLNSVFKADHIFTSAAIYYYSVEDNLFRKHKDYIENLQLDYNLEDFVTLDGTNQLYFGKDNYSLLKFCDTWDFVARYGYQVSWGYKEEWLSNLSFVIKMCNYNVEPLYYNPFFARHNTDIRY